MKKKLTLIVIASTFLITAGLIGLQDKDNKSTVDEQKQVVIEKHASFPNFPLDDAIKEASLVVKGSPVKIIQTFSEGENNPITEFLFKVDDLYKGEGSITQNNYISVFQDGAVGDEYEEHPLMQLETEYVLILEEPIEDKYVMVGGPSGKFEFNDEKNLFISSTDKKVKQIELKSLSLNNNK